MFRKSTISTLLVVFFTLGLAIGCSDDDDPPAKDMTVAKDMAVDKTVTQKEGGTTEAGPSDGSMSKDWNTSGKCANAADAALLDTKAKRDKVTATAQSCGLGCLNSDAGAATCSAACVATGTGLSTGCAGCYAGIILCTATKCLAQCAVDPTSAACLKCQTDNGCYTEFYKCSGMPQ